MIKLKFKKRFLTIIICLCALFVFASPVFGNAVYTATIVFLGDSIANGAMLADKENERYSTLIGNKMNAEIINHAVDGMTTSSLIYALNSGAYDASLAKADYVSISIGSNDLLTPFIGIMTDLFGSMNAGAFLTLNNTELANMFTKLNDTITKNETLTAACNIYSKLNTILSIVQEKAPKSEILMNNIYNPYIGVKILLLDKEYLNLEAQCETYVRLINRNFFSNSPAYTLINVYRLFSEGGFTNANFNLLNMMESSFDSHPNAKGHEAIGEAILKVIDIMPHPIDIEGHWGKDYIRAMIHKGLFSGLVTDTFEPDSPMTRGMFVTVFGRLINADVSVYTESAFKDVVNDTYYSPYVAWAADKKLVFGIGDGNFSPDTPIKREDMAVILQRCITNLKYTIPANLSTSAQFNDENSISSAAKESVTLIRQLEIMMGDDKNNFNPLKSITNAEVVTMLWRFDNIFG